MPLKLLKPPKLAPGATLGVVAPSLPVMASAKEAYSAGKARLQAFGFRLQEGETVGLTRWWSAGTPRERADDINAMFANPEVRAIVAANGGFSAMSLLDLLDYDLIRDNPKPFIGFSDITLLHLAMFTRCGLVGFHGSTLIGGFGDFFPTEASSAETLRDLYLHALTTTQPLGPIRPLSSWACWREGVAEGTLIGGNLKRFAALAGTPYFPPLEVFDGAILFWEEIGDSLYDIALNLYKLKHVGVLRRLSGMVVGKLTWVNTYFDELEHPSVREAVLDVLEPYRFPILADVDFGHHLTSVPLPLGVSARLDSGAHLLELTEAGVA